MQTAKRDRLGISLLEVLFGIFVLAVGLLGLAAMVPIGRSQIVEAEHADRASACGRAAFREIKVRDMMDEAFWRNASGQVFAPNPGETFVIDPLSVSTNGNSVATFPAGQGSAWPKRITLIDAATRNLMTPGLAERVFRWNDDLKFELPPNKDYRPLIVNPGQPIQNQSDGNYSWLVMVTPGEGALFRISAVVFYKRDLVVDSNADAPSERVLYADLMGGGLGGGDIRLRATAGGDPEKAKKRLAVRQNQWIMLSAEPTAGGPAVHNWYRVVKISETTAGQLGTTDFLCDATLAGADISTAGLKDADSDNTTGTTFYATICDGVIGVFEKTVQLDEPSLWTSH